MPLSCTMPSRDGHLPARWRTLLHKAGRITTLLRKHRDTDVRRWWSRQRQSGPLPLSQSVTPHLASTDSPHLLKWERRFPTGSYFEKGAGNLGSACPRSQSPVPGHSRGSLHFFQGVAGASLSRARPLGPHPTWLGGSRAKVMDLDL